MKYAKMSKSLKNKWVAALRSGKYEQTTGRLRRVRASGIHLTGHCCLGVLQEVAGRECGGKLFASEDLLPRDIQKTLAVRNDDGWTFKRIASWVERHL